MPGLIFFSFQPYTAEELIACDSSRDPNGNTPNPAVWQNIFDKYFNVPGWTMTCSDTIMEARKIYVFHSEGGSGRVHFMSFHLSDHVVHVFAKIMQLIHSKKRFKNYVS